MKIGIVANQVKPVAKDIAEKIITYLHKLGVETVYPRNIYDDNSEGDSLNNVDYIIVLGGDGTILGLVRVLGNKNIPILGVNLGSLGFIAETDPNHFIDALDSLIKGDFYISERIMLKGSVYKEGSTAPKVYYSMNEFVVSKAENVRLLSIDTYINDEFLVNYKADGIIVACSTGSTAYNLSAGGPVMHPGVKDYIITPICPHTLSERPLIVPKTEVFAIKVAEGQKGLFTIDGQCNEIITENDLAKIEVSHDTVKLVEFNKAGFYHKLKSRLFWGK